MNILADEGVDAPIVAQLRAEGYTVWYVAELSPSITDDEVLALASEHQALLITADKDFGELVFRLQRVAGGIVLIRLNGVSLQRKIATVRQAFSEHYAEMVNAFSVITPGVVRIRPRMPLD